MKQFRNSLLLQHGKTSTWLWALRPDTRPHSPLLIIASIKVQWKQIQRPPVKLKPNAPQSGVLFALHGGAHVYFSSLYPSIVSQSNKSHACFAGKYRLREHLEDFFSSMVSLPKVQQLFGIGQNCSYKALLELAKKSKVSRSRDISAQEQATFFLYVCVGTLKSESYYGLIIVWRGSALHRFPVIFFLVWSDLLLPYLWAGCVFISQCLSFFFITFYCSRDLWGWVVLLSA